MLLYKLILIINSSWQIALKDIWSLLPIYDWISCTSRSQRWYACLSSTTSLINSRIMAVNLLSILFYMIILYFKIVFVIFIIIVVEEHFKNCRWLLRALFFFFSYKNWWKWTTILFQINKYTIKFAIEKCAAQNTLSDFILDL